MDLSERREGSTRRHPWEKARANFFRSVVRRQLGGRSQPVAVLDVGAGDGYLAQSLFGDLPAGSRVVCCDVNYSDADLASYGEQAPPGVTFTRQPPDEKFDVLLLLDVIEHVADDVALLRQLTERHLAPDGRVVLSVPAWQGLFSRHDEALRHYRRYSPQQFRRVIREQGLQIDNEGGLFHSLVIPRALAVARERFLRWLGKEPALPPAADDWKFGPLVSTIVDKMLAADNAVTQAVPVPLPGLSVWAACRAADRTAADRAGTSR